MNSVSKVITNNLQNFSIFPQNFSLKVNNAKFLTLYSNSLSYSFNAKSSNYASKRFYTVSSQNVTPPQGKMISLTHVGKEQGFPINVYSMCLRRDEARNALSLGFLAELENQISFLKTVSPSPRVLLIWSVCKKVFCAGADLKERLNLNHEQAKFHSKTLKVVFNEIADLKFPTVACVDGAALGGGFEFALTCDFRFVSQNAYFGLPESSLAIMPGAGATQRLPRLIGLPKAKWLAFSSEKISSEKAIEWGIADNYIETELKNQGIELWETFCNAHKADSQLYEVLKDKPSLKSSMNLIKGLVKTSSFSVELIKQSIQQGVQTSLEEGLKIEADIYKQTMLSEDRMEALKAFREKRAPNFKN